MKRRTLITESFLSSNRRTDLLIVHSFEFYENNFIYRGIMLWNKHPSMLKNNLFSVDHFRLLFIIFIIIRIRIYSDNHPTSQA